MHLKNGRSSGNGAYEWEGFNLRVMVASDLRAAPVPEIMDVLSYTKTWIIRAYGTRTTFCALYDFKL
jgi:hypothetical protein